ncbi:hypothetical protein [Thermomonas sp.]|uniref:DUF7210 family protein n=1 Tax=Thermomonas sp. TaxID=1971895 RepID=UPI002629D633|nr:hypothetical protein [Thermomonas sp.]HRO86921.1 hypothetical protein [Chiayiivirga sp.]
MKEQPKTVTVIVTATGHTHDRKPVAKGDRIEVDASTADWMVQHKIGQLAPAKPTDKTKTETLP